MDTFPVDVEYVGADDEFAAPARRTRVHVTAESATAAELAALQMVAASGRKPVSVAIDWEAF